jgi:hypothetical protein
VLPDCQGLISLQFTVLYLPPLALLPVREHVSCSTFIEPLLSNSLLNSFQHQGCTNVLQTFMCIQICFWMYLYFLITYALPISNLCKVSGEVSTCLSLLEGNDTNRINGLAGYHHSYISNFNVFVLICTFVWLTFTTDFRLCHAFRRNKKGEMIAKNSNEK